jgi:ferredoxin
MMGGSMDYSIAIDADRCTQCETCIDHCPNDVLYLKDGIVSEKPENSCFHCGHCVLVCPAEAIRYSTSPLFFSAPRGIPEVKESQRIFHTKKSTRRFSEREISPEDIDSLIEYAEKAPSACNFRNRKYHVITNEKLVHEIKENIYRNCLAFLFKVNPLTISLVRIFNGHFAGQLRSIRNSVKTIAEGYKKGKDTLFFDSKCIICISSPSYTPYAHDDCVIAEQYLMLYGSTIGIESCISGLAQESSRGIQKLLKLGKYDKIYSVTILGYKKTDVIKEILFKNHKVVKYT